MALLSIFILLWETFKNWIWTLVVSFTSLQTFWIILPIWISWFFAEFFQEKEGTSFGNAISNGVIPFWVGIDWIRQLTNELMDGQAKFSVLIFSKYAISSLILIYGVIIIIYGIKAKSFVHLIGRIREVTYVLVVFTPFIYGLIQPTFTYFIGIFLFFPLYYFIIEGIDRLVPEPEVYKEKEEEKKLE